MEAFSWDILTNNVSGIHFLFSLFFDSPAWSIVEEKAQFCAILRDRYNECVKTSRKNAQVILKRYTGHFIQNYHILQGIFDCLTSKGVQWNMFMDGERSVLPIKCDGDKMMCNILPPKVRSLKNKF